MKQFRIYPMAGSSLFFKVFVFPTRDEMEFYLNEVNETYGIEQDHSDSYGVFSRHVITSYATGRARTRPNFGHLYLSEDNMTAEIVSHEATHAMFQWLRRVASINKRYRENVVAILLGGIEDRPYELDPEEKAALVVSKTVALVAMKLRKPWF